LRDAIFCRTIMPNGDINNTGCGAGTACCPICTPATCQSLGKQCGAWPDGCGGTLQCGTCEPGLSCKDGRCVVCTPDQCGRRQCGSWPDGCGRSIYCGTCVIGYFCIDGVCRTSAMDASVDRAPRSISAAR
jgi:hypothetical protein